MKVIKIGGEVADLTVDTTLVTADSTVITADLTETTLNDLKVFFLPRITPSVDDTLVVTLTRELNDDVITPEFEWGFIDNYVRLVLDDAGFVVGEKYAIKVVNNDEIIYKGKLLVTDIATDVQNYTKTNIVNGKLKF